MNIYIMTDMEGISGIFHKEQVLTDGNRYSEGRKFMTMDINACAKACKENGADKVYVCDCHGGGSNVLIDELSDAIDYCICGSRGFDRFPDIIKECDGVILLGYHAMAGTKGAVLEHSMSSKSIQNYWINGEKSGEIAIDAGILGDLGVPVIMVSGDDRACTEANEILPWAVTAEVKKGLSTMSAMMLPLEKAHELIKAKTAEAIRNIKNMSLHIHEKPVKFRVELMERVPLPNPKAKPYMSIIDGRTFEVVADTMEEAFWRSI